MNEAELDQIRGLLSPIVTVGNSSHLELVWSPEGWDERTNLRLVPAVLSLLGYLGKTGSILCERDGDYVLRFRPYNPGDDALFSVVGAKVNSCAIEDLVAMAEWGLIEDSPLLRRAVIKDLLKVTEAGRALGLRLDHRAPVEATDVSVMARLESVRNDLLSIESTAPERAIIDAVALPGIDLAISAISMVNQGYAAASAAREMLVGARERLAAAIDLMDRFNIILDFAKYTGIAVLLKEAYDLVRQAV